MSASVTPPEVGVTNVVLEDVPEADMDVVTPLEATTVGAKLRVKLLSRPTTSSWCRVSPAPVTVPPAANCPVALISEGAPCPDTAPAAPNAVVESCPGVNRASVWPANVVARTLWKWA